jgi:tetrapyrrole methylase family protein/MazG family protein
VEDSELKTAAPALAELIDLIGRLRGPGGCPWDREQTPRSMARYLIEEAFELADAVESGEPEPVCEEMGDVLFQLLFLAQLYAEARAFDLEEVCRRIAEKMRRRHPHVFGDAAVSGSAEVKANWQLIKQRERRGGPPASVLDGLPRGLPALMRAHAVSERAARARFDWGELPGVLAKLGEELAEFQAACAAGEADRLAEELGDLLFTAANIARFCGVHPETALAAATRKFEGRFREMERRVAASGRSLEAVPQAEKDRIWEAVKRERTPAPNG